MPFLQRPLLLPFELAEIPLSLFCLSRVIPRYFGFDVTVAKPFVLLSFTAFLVNATLY